jgi:hypothetical protein
MTQMLTAQPGHLLFRVRWVKGYFPEATCPVAGSSGNARRGQAYEMIDSGHLAKCLTAWHTLDCPMRPMTQDALLHFCECAEEV